MAKENQGSQERNEILRLAQREIKGSCKKTERIRFKLRNFDVSAHSTDVTKNFEALEGQLVSVAGRIMTKRVMGKASFWPYSGP